MYPAPFTYHRASSVDDALAILSADEDAKILAGGQSLLPAMKLRLAQPGTLVDISELDELRGVRMDGDDVVIGALTRHHELETDATIQTRLPLLADMARVVGDQQVRNRGTIGGSLAHADPAADYPAGALALEAVMEVQGPNGQRSIPIGEWFQGFLTTALEPNEVLVSIRIPALPDGARSTYEKLANPASGYAIVGVAAIALDGDVRVAITGASDMAYRATAVEDGLRGQAPDDAALREAANLATDGIEPLDDPHAPADYRRTVTQNLVYRAVTRVTTR